MRFPKPISWSFVNLGDVCKKQSFAGDTVLDLFLSLKDKTSVISCNKILQYFVSFLQSNWDVVNSKEPLPLTFWCSSIDAGQGSIGATLLYLPNVLIDLFMTVYHIVQLPRPFYYLIIDFSTPASFEINLLRIRQNRKLCKL